MVAWWPLSAPCKTPYESLNKILTKKHTLTAVETTTACIEKVFFRLKPTFRLNVWKISRYYMSSKIFLRMPVKKFRFCKILGSKTENR